MMYAEREKNMILRDYRNSDSSIICKWLRTEDELYKWSADRFNKFPLAGNDIIDNYTPQIKSGRFIPLTAVDADDSVIGHFIIRYPKETDDSTVRFGFVIVDPKLRNRGYGKEMLLLGIKYVKDHLSAQRIDLGVFADNSSAKRCYEAVGFREYSSRQCELPIGVWECIDMELFTDNKNT